MGDGWEQNGLGIGIIIQHKFILQFNNMSDTPKADPVTVQCEQQMRSTGDQATLMDHSAISPKDSQISPAQQSSGHTSNLQQTEIHGTIEIQQAAHKPDRNSFQYGQLPTHVGSLQLENEPVIVQQCGMPIPSYPPYYQQMCNPLHFQPDAHHPHYQFQYPYQYPSNWAGFVPPMRHSHWKHRQFQSLRGVHPQFSHKFKGRGKFVPNAKDKYNKKQNIHQARDSSGSSSSHSQHNSHQKAWNKCRKSKEYQQKHKCYQINNHKIQSDSEKSQSEEQLNTVGTQIQKISLTDEKRQNFTDFQNSLSQFFNKYNIKEKNRIKTVQYLVARYNKLQDLDPLISTLFELERTSPHYFTLKKLNFSAIVKSIIKKGFVIQQINGQLDKKLYLKQKRNKCDRQFRQKYPKREYIDYLDLEGLLKLEQKKTLFLVDGNNIMQRQKKFRLYYESNYSNERAQGQVRLIWLFAESLNAQVFFDTRYSDQLYKGIKQSILSNQEKQAVEKVPVHFADKQLNAANTADIKIVSRLTQIIDSQIYKNYRIVLVSADRELAQLCNAIVPIEKTSGKDIFKYCKAMIRKKHYHNPAMRDLIKRIFTY